MSCPDTIEIFWCRTQTCMSKKIQDLKVKLDEDLQEKIERLAPDYSSYRILRKSLDARRKHEIHFVYSVEIFEKDEHPTENEFHLERMDNYKGPKPLIVGMGPAGLFAALRLAERGIPSTLIERGSDAQKRMVKINRFWRYGELDPDDNVAFGEGGAGFYSDGKLTTRIKSPHIPYVLRRFVDLGAPEEIQWMANPHIGSDRIRRLLIPFRRRLLELGCEIHFHQRVSRVNMQGDSVCGVTTVDGTQFRSPLVLLATGHSALDLFEHLHEIGVAMEGKSFALGLRIEHPQDFIDRSQYRSFAGHPQLEAANYQLTHHDPHSQMGTYSFCMCPGGYVISSSSEMETAVCNGMSNYRRNSGFANSGIVVTVKVNSKDLFGGFKLARAIEKRARSAVQDGGGHQQLPVQRVVDFLEGRRGPSLPTSSPSGVLPVRLDQMLDPKITDHLRQGLQAFDQKIVGFCSERAQLYGVESRTSCPIRILRDPTSFESPSHRGLFPAGEGAGYAGGITSAACDGVRIADALYERLK